MDEKMTLDELLEEPIVYAETMKALTAALQENAE